MKKKIFLVLIVVIVLFAMVGCDTIQTSTNKDVARTLAVGDELSKNQPTPTDVDASYERYNLIRRTYWVNGQRERARTLPCPIPDVPLGYVVLLTESGSVVAKFVVEGKVSSLQNYLTPISEYYEGISSYVNDTYPDGSTTGNHSYVNKWLPDVDGTYGDNDDGIFFFTPDGKYVEWSGIYLYSDIPFEVADPVVKYQAGDTNKISPKEETVGTGNSGRINHNTTATYGGVIAMHTAHLIMAAH